MCKSEIQALFHSGIKQRKNFLKNPEIFFYQQSPTFSTPAPRHFEKKHRPNKYITTHKKKDRPVNKRISSTRMTLNAETEDLPFNFCLSPRKPVTRKFFRRSQQRGSSWGTDSVRPISEHMSCCLSPNSALLTPAHGKSGRGREGDRKRGEWGGRVRRGRGRGEERGRQIDRQR